MSTETARDETLNLFRYDNISYRLIDHGYHNRLKIYGNRRHLGWVKKQADTWIGVIGRTIKEQGATAKEAASRAVTTLLGIDISELTPEMLNAPKVQANTEVILDWLKDNAAANDGTLKFSNTDLARVLGWKKPNQPLGNLISRMDLACYRADLPPLGCAAERTFDRAWSQHRGIDKAWKFPADKMIAAAKSRRWSPDDFARIKQESRCIQNGVAYLAWEEEHVANEAKIRMWADGLGNK